MQSNRFSLTENSMSTSVLTDEDKILDEIADLVASKIVELLPESTSRQILQYNQELSSEVTKRLSRKVLEYMKSPEFAEKMLQVFDTGDMAALYAEQLGIVGAIVQQNLQLFLIQNAEEIQRLQSDRQKLQLAQKNDRQAQLEHKWKQIKATKLLALEWAIAFSQWWRLLAAAIAGAIIAGPIFINWPEKVLCDRGDWLCLQLRVREGKYIRK
jgi:hypothetical protein